MTRPIYEPSLQRTDRRLTYGNDQLFRRPAPTAADVAAYPYVFRELAGSGQVVGGGTLATISWDTFIDDQAQGYFSAEDTESFSIDEPITADDIGGGVYEFLVYTHWDPEFNSFCQVQVACNPFGYFPTAYGKPSLYSSGGSQVDGAAALTLSFQARLPQGSSSTSIIVAHENASNQTIEYAVYRVARVGTWLLTGDAQADQGDFPIP